MSEISDLRRLIKIHQRRWQKLKEQKAFSGPATDPAVLMEIEDLAVEISRLKRKLTVLEQTSFPLGEQGKEMVNSTFHWVLVQIIPAGFMWQIPEITGCKYLIVMGTIYHNFQLMQIKRGLNPQTPQT